MPNPINPALVRSGTFGEFWYDGELMSEVYGCQIKVSKTKETIARCGTLVEGHKMMAVRITGSMRMYNINSRLIKRLSADLKAGKDTRGTIISKLADPDNPEIQRFAVYGVSFDDLPIADWEVGKVGSFEMPFTADAWEDLEA